MSDLLDVACLLIDHNNEVLPGEDVFLVYLSPVATVQSLKKEIRSSRSPVLDRVDPLRLVVWRFLDSDNYLQTSIDPEAREKVVRDAFMDRNRIKYVDVAAQIQELKLSLRPKEVLLVQMPRVSDSITGSPALSCYQNVTDSRSLDQYKDLCFEVTAWTKFKFQDLEVSGLDESSLELPSPDFVDKLRRVLDAKPGMPPDEQLSAVFSSTFIEGRRMHFAPTSQPEPPQRIADTNEVSHTSFLERPWEDYWTENDGPGLTESFAGTLFFHTVYGMAYDAPCDVEIGTTTGSKSWTYPILVHNVNGTPGDQLRIYTPRSDFCISSSGLPRLIVEVQSGSDDGSTPPDYVLMLLCGAVVVRFANRFCGEFKSAKNFALVATYIRKSGKAEQFILFQRNNIEHKVFYIREAMLLQRPNPRIRYARMLRNFLHMLRREGGDGTEAIVHKYMSVVNNSSLKTLYHKSTNPNKRKRNAGDEGNQNNPAGGRNPADDRHVDGGDDYEDRDEGSYSDGDSGDDSGGNDSGDDDDPRPQKVDIANLTERYIVHERKAIKIDRGYLKPIGQMPSNLKVVSRRSDSSKRLIAKLVPRLIAKFVPKRSGNTELEILRYIESRPSKSKNVISLLDFISPERGSGSWVILPQYPSSLQKYLDEVSLQGEPSSIRKYVPALCWGLVSGLAFLHEQSVAHRDIKPSNVLLAGGADFQPVLIDFDCAVLVKNEEEKVADYCGTEGWMAPEVERKEAHSPIRADRWACGRFILHILNQVKGDDDELKACAAKLMVDDPAERLQLGRWCKTPSRETAAEAAEVIPQRRPHETSDLRGHSATLG